MDNVAAVRVPELAQDPVPEDNATASACATTATLETPLTKRAMHTPGQTAANANLLRAGRGCFGLSRSARLGSWVELHWRLQVDGSAESSYNLPDSAGEGAPPT